MDRYTNQRVALKSLTLSTIIRFSLFANSHAVKNTKREIFSTLEKLILSLVSVGW